ncbi:MAG: helix-turn-helix transcriptional regulator, partial [Clostridiaceae bacterium]|nr:helix-turn-helix transcriptional regulator [Clostridiaceae bacterium]
MLYAMITEGVGEIMHDFGNQLQSLRRAKGLSQSDLAGLLNIENQQTISKFENSVLPSMSMIKRIAEVLNVNYRLLFTSNLELKDIVRELYNLWTNLDTRGNKRSKTKVDNRNILVPNYRALLLKIESEQVEKSNRNGYRNDDLLYGLKKLETGCR